MLNRRLLLKGAGTLATPTVIEGTGALATPTDIEGAVYAEIDKIVAEGITAEELEGVKQRARANFIRGLRSNGGMAGQLASTQTYTGDWRDVFKQVEEIEAVTLEDVKRVAGEVFVKSNRNVAIIETESDS